MTHFLSWSHSAWARVRGPDGLAELRGVLLRQHGVADLDENGECVAGDLGRLAP
jgi:hypothetical protein